MYRAVTPDGQPRTHQPAHPVTARPADIKQLTAGRAGGKAGANFFSAITKRRPVEFASTCDVTPVVLFRQLPAPLPSWRVRSGAWQGRASNRRRYGRKGKRRVSDEGQGTPRRRGKRKFICTRLCGVR